MSTRVRGGTATFRSISQDWVSVLVLLCVEDTDILAEMVVFAEAIGGTYCQTLRKVPTDCSIIVHVCSSLHTVDRYVR